MHQFTGHYYPMPKPSKFLGGKENPERIRSPTTQPKKIKLCSAQLQDTQTNPPSITDKNLNFG